MVEDGRTRKERKGEPDKLYCFPLRTNTINNVVKGRKAQLYPESPQWYLAGFNPELADVIRGIALQEGLRDHFFAHYFRGVNTTYEMLQDEARGVMKDDRKAATHLFIPREARGYLTNWYDNMKGNSSGFWEAIAGIINQRDILEDSKVYTDAILEIGKRQLPDSSLDPEIVKRMLDAFTSGGHVVLQLMKQYDELLQLRASVRGRPSG